VRCSPGLASLDERTTPEELESGAVSFTSLNVQYRLPVDCTSRVTSSPPTTLLVPAATALLRRWSCAVPEAVGTEVPTRTAVQSEASAAARIDAARLRGGRVAGARLRVDSAAFMTISFVWCLFLNGHGVRSLPRRWQWMCPASVPSRTH
jgi:hypothetical protein